MPIGRKHQENNRTMRATWKTLGQGFLFLGLCAGYAFTSPTFHKANSALLPSGLSGPVQIIRSAP